jgi:alkyl sulfatase BDS1-like metallo-beta-lactamase superfamily hydrolase
VYVHEEALKGFNAGVDVWTLMEKIELPPELRVGQGYGKVSWAVRTFWEEYVGWFKLESTTEFYPDSAPAALAELLALTGVDAALERAEAALERGNAPLAIKLGEAIAQQDADNERLRSLMANAHQHLLDNGGDVSFWENGWLRTELARWSEPTP